MTLRQGQLQVGGTQIRYSDMGSGSLVVILDAGIGGLPRLQEALAGRYRVLRLELGGLGDAPDNAGSPPAEELGGLAAVTTGQLTNDKYTLVGASASADIALWQTLQAPQDVEALVLISPLYILPTGGSHDAAAESRLGDVGCATLAVFGLKDQMVAPEAARVYREKIPNSNVSLVYDAGHDIMADRPEALIDLVADFTERRETFVVGRQSSVINP